MRAKLKETKEELKRLRHLSIPEPGAMAQAGRYRLLRLSRRAGEYIAGHVPFGRCDGVERFSSDWPGIDGKGSNDVLQAGVEVDAYCSGGTTQAFYYAWFERYSNFETQVSSPAINPGDLVFVQVWNASRQADTPISTTTPPKTPPYSRDRNPDALVWKHLKADPVGRMAVSRKDAFKTKLRSFMRRLQNNPEKIRSLPPKTISRIRLMNV